VRNHIERNTTTNIQYMYVCIYMSHLFLEFFLLFYIDFIVVIHISLLFALSEKARESFCGNVNCIDNETFTGIFRYRDIDIDIERVIE
jgi:hypothetical protein